ncbi:restriction endonuclease subunit S [Candidatus Margulisiibacteriota bacterium]
MAVFKTVKLGEIAEICSGGTPSSTNPDFWGGGEIYWATLPDLQKKYLYETQRKITKLGLENSSAKLLPINTIIFSSRATIGEISISKVETTTNQGSKNLICNPEKANYEYLYYCLKFNARRIEQLASGATYKEINKNDLSNVEISLPDLSNQTRIASVLCAYDDLIENNEKRIKILEEMAQRLYTEWFVKFKFPGHEKVKMVDSGTEYGMIPEGWEVKSTAELFDILGGGTPARKAATNWNDGDINWFTPTDITRTNQMFIDESSEKITKSGLKTSSAKLFSPYSIMMTSRATIGAISINTVSASTNQGFIVCLPNSEVPLYFLYYWLRARVPSFIALASGATFKELSRGVFKKIKMLCPDGPVLNEFENKVKPVAKLILFLQRQIRNLSKTRDLLIPQLVTGKRLVNNNDKKS